MRRFPCFRRRPAEPDFAAAFFIWMLFAIGARLSQKSSVAGLASPESYYAKAMEHRKLFGSTATPGSEN